MSGSIQFLGDTHLGRKFKTGVPLHRIGDREKMVEEEFKRRLLNLPEDTKVHIHLGDLFDKPMVSPDVILMAATTYIRASFRNPDTVFYILLGNHDASRDSSKKTAFDLFSAIVGPYENIIPVKAPTYLEEHNLGLLPYNVFGTAEEYLEDMVAHYVPATVIGHWDILDFGGDNVIPTKLMAQHEISWAITGHDHLARMETRDNVQIKVWGSMQPYSHAEDRDNLWYTTLELAEVLEKQDQLVNMNVRVLLKEGESLPTDIDCLSMIGKRLTSDENIEVDTSEFEGFDLASALSKAIPDSIRGDVMRFYDEVRND